MIGSLKPNLVKVPNLEDASFIMKRWLGRENENVAQMQ